jgi:hypothetical protein
VRSRARRQSGQGARSHCGGGAQRAPNVVCLPELFQTQYFCQREDAALFDLAEPIPGRNLRKARRRRPENKVVLIASLFEKRAPGLYHNTAAIFDSDGALVGIYRKMHIPDDPLYYEKFISLPAISASRLSIPRPENSARSSAGISGIPKGRASRRCRERAFCFTPRPSDGIRRRRPSSARRNTMPGAPSSGRMPSRTAFMSAW